MTLRNFFNERFNDLFSTRAIIRFMFNFVKKSLILKKKIP